MTDTITYAEALSEIRKTAKENGMTFKEQNATINGKKAYKFVDCKSGRILGENFTLWSAYENCLNGFIGTLNY